MTDKPTSTPIPGDLPAAAGAAPVGVGFGMLVLLGAAAISAVVVGRRGHRLDLIAVLKTRE